jgi:predicted nucleotidyltransferase
MRIPTANWDRPWADELASILAQTVGGDPRVADALRDVPGIEAAYLFGSWVGTDEPAPNDIDLLIVGRPDRRAVRDRLRDRRNEFEDARKPERSLRTDEIAEHVATARAIVEAVAAALAPSPDG